MQFETIDIKTHRDKVIEFRKDSFVVSFGDAANFGDGGDYLNWLKDKISDFPNGFVVINDGGKYIGQLELSTREYKGETIGYVHLYYLTAEQRGKGKGKELHRYAKQFFKSNQVSEFHLRVSPSNIAAIKFYHKLGMEEVGPEAGGKVIRMKGYL